MRHLRPVQTAAFLLLIALYLSVRVWGMTSSCLWFDEIFSVHAAEHAWNTILSFVALDLIHPPLFYVLLKLWIAAGGEGLFWLRAFPVFFSITALIPFLLLCTELKLAVWTRILSLSFIAVNGSLIKYGQEVRMYSLLMCFSLFSMWLFARYFVKGKSFVPLVIINLLLIYTHYFGWFVVMSEVGAILAFQRIKWRRMAVMFGILAAAFLPWVYAVWSSYSAGTGLGQNIGWMSRPAIREIFQFITALVEPFYYQASTADPVSIFRVSLPILLIVAAAVIAYFANRSGKTADHRDSIKLLVLFIVLPLIAAFAASWILPYSIWGTRHLILVFVPISILVAIAVSEIPVSWVRTSAITLIVLLSGYAFVLESVRVKPVYSWCAWEPLATQAVSAAPQQDIYVLEDLVAYHTWFALRNDPVERSNIFRLTGVDGLAEDKAYFLPRGFDDVQTVGMAEVNDPKLWLGYRFKSVDEKEPPLRNFLIKGYHVAEQKVIDAGGERAIFLLLEK